jgi:ketosteroid isomerase-like protein
MAGRTLDAQPPASEALVRDFVARINAHDVARIIAVCTVGHRFIDSLGNVLTGHERLRQAWSGYFRLFPDYRMEIDSIAAVGGLAYLSGFASGTLAPRTPDARPGTWRIPAAWRAEVRGDSIDVWQVYADTRPVDELLARDV